MKRILCLVLAISLLCGCGLTGNRTYIVVEPHNESYQVNKDSQAISVRSYLSLKNAIMSLVEDGITEGVIRAESYSGDLAEDLSEAVYEVSRGEPLGLYAVDYMTYDYSKIVSYYEINIHTTFRHSKSDIADVIYLESSDAIPSYVREAMANFDSKLCMYISSYQSFDYDTLIREVLMNHPECALELPEVSVSFYPESGSQQIVEMTFEYQHSTEELQSAKQEITSRILELSNLYGSSIDDKTSVRRIYNRVIRDGILVEKDYVSDGYIESPYGALIENRATSFGYALTLGWMLSQQEIPCSVIRVYLGEREEYLCEYTLDEKTYYADAAFGVLEKNDSRIMMEESDLWLLGYSIP